MSPKGGRFDVAAIRKSAPDLLAADSVIRGQATRMAGIDLSRLIGPVRRQVSSVELQLNEVSATAASAARVAKVGPWLFDSKKPRRLLVVFTNNAEIRATGGMPGAFGVLTIDRGKVTFGQQTDAGGIGPQDTPAGGLTEAERSLWSDRLVYLPQDTNFTPDYPRGAEFLRTMWQRKVPGRIDGVLSVDPVSMSYLLQGADPIESEGVSVTAANAVSMLLNQIYLQIPDTEVQNKIFADVAAEAFRRIAAGKVDPKAAFIGLQRGIEERRILLYLHDKEMQQVIAGSRVSGQLDFASTPRPQVGVYFNDATSTKMDYYLRYQTSVESLSCTDDRQRLRVSVKMTSTVPKDLSKLTPSILGPADNAPSGVLATSINLVAPAGGSIGKFLADGREPVDLRADLEGREVSVTRVFLRPGESTLLTYEVTARRGQIGNPDVRVTPGVADLGIEKVGQSSCS